MQIINKKVPSEPLSLTRSKIDQIIILFIVFSYLIFSDPPQITKPQTPTKSINFAESASIECLAEGNPQPQYKWTNAAGVVKTTDNRLRLGNVDDSDGGNYTCTATNTLGSDSFTIFVKVTSNFYLFLT